MLLFLDTKWIILILFFFFNFRFSINSNKFPINKIKLVDASSTSKQNYLKNYFITYDTSGCDWTIRLWDLQLGDQLVSAITMPSRILSLDINTSPFYLDSASSSTQEQQQQHTATTTTTLAGLEQDVIMAVSLYGVSQVLIVRLDTSASLMMMDAKKQLVSLENFSSNDAVLNGLIKEINLWKHGLSLSIFLSSLLELLKKILI